MLTTCTVFVPPLLEVLLPESLLLPHAASSAPAPLTAARLPAALPMNARRVDGANGSRVPSLPTSLLRSWPLPGPSVRYCPLHHVLALVLSIVESCHGIRNRLSAMTAR